MAERLTSLVPIGLYVVLRILYGKGEPEFLLLYTVKASSKRRE
jgi:hypothetical protein